MPQETLQCAAWLIEAELLIKNEQVQKAAQLLVKILKVEWCNVVAYKRLLQLQPGVDLGAVFGTLSAVAASKKVDIIEIKRKVTATTRSQAGGGVRMNFAMTRSATSSSSSLVSATTPGNANDKKRTRSGMQKPSVPNLLASETVGKTQMGTLTQDFMNIVFQLMQAHATFNVVAFAKLMHQLQDSPYKLSYSLLLMHA